MAEHDARKHLWLSTTAIYELHVGRVKHFVLTSTGGEVEWTEEFAWSSTSTGAIKDLGNPRTRKAEARNRAIGEEYAARKAEAGIARDLERRFNRSERTIRAAHSVFKKST